VANLWSAETRIGPLRFQAGCHRRRLNLALFFGLILCCGIFCYGFVVAFCCVCFSFALLSQEIGWEERLRNVNQFGIPKFGPDFPEGNFWENWSRFVTERIVFPWTKSQCQSVSSWKIQKLDDKLFSNFCCEFLICVYALIACGQRLSELELFLPSFHAQYGYRNKLCAADVVRACEALLDSMVRSF